ncbi:hypothetical protein LEP1GSC008_3591 [Leptospira kirschneri serovar Bulgarica str. Nikolaevo]|uniref:Uncharacterized protein n=2 Tax=Leptospira kirschneri TaxID=29507 RepID=A0A0E2BJI7_9LEPT|nr:hypothetical protein LEP1GSC081_0496 [Leptospira kirschneri str. H1]EMK21798.1 hypothetical protein LEP1GSC008_3591 [Leptospira kirschneri serovar Bulgarica str. Nikolaevo]
MNPMFPVADFHPNISFGLYSSKLSAVYKIFLKLGKIL